MYGTEGWTEEHTAAVKNVRRVRLPYDADEAGDRAAARDAERLQALSIEVWHIKFPFGMDANEYARKVTPATQSLPLLITAAQWMGKGKGDVPASVVPVETPAPTSPLIAASVSDSEEKSAKEKNPAARENAAASAPSTSPMLEQRGKRGSCR